MRPVDALDAAKPHRVEDVDSREGALSPLLIVEGADFGYEGRPVVLRASLEVRPNEFVVLLGSNGSGKTTLLRGLLGFLPPLAGRVERRPGLRIGYVPQRETLDPLYPLSAFDVVRLGAWRDLPFWRMGGARERTRTREALAACRATDFAGQRYAALSGGQRQRVLLARALATAPELLLLDEPTAGIDPEAEQGILDLLRELRETRGISIWMVTHHVHSIRGRADRTVVVSEGRVQQEETA
jgi:ABC-type Mn2+/Zn2+ transport system ATPase subunit